MTDLSVLRLLNGSTGDPGLYVDFPGTHDAVLVDAGDLTRLSTAELADVGVFLLTHHHLDHFGDFDRLLRHSIDRDKTIQMVGPEGTLDKLEARLASLAFQRFPFMKLRFEATEVRWDAPSWPRAAFACQAGFKRENLSPLKGGSRRYVLTNPQVRIRVTPASHTVPCLSYAIEIRRGWRFDPHKASGKVLARGPWIGQVMRHLAKPTAERPQDIQLADATGYFRLRDLVRDYFTHQPAQTIVFITDTRRDPATWAGHVALSKGADWLFCDSYYPAKETKGATKHGHLTVTQAAELAAEAGVKSLWLMHLGKRFRRDYPAMLAAAQEIFPATHAQWPLDLPPNAPAVLR